MYLKQVDMENFKTFAGKVSVPIMEGYMAITGPNGSGKSNITDAILFVLGPKSAKAMRAGKLTDLIHLGKSGKRADFMSATLYFDNTDRTLPWDSDEVRFTRTVKVSANGEDYTSQYYVNEQKSSLSEFDSLLTKARISADGYNIVQQGDVTDITKMSATDRRRILDGIAGISSYDADIARAQNEKNGIDTELSTIKILTDNLETELGQLEKDMEAAKKYRETKDKLDLANAQLVHRQLINEEGKLEFKQGARNKVGKELEDVEKERDLCTDRLEVIEEDLNKTEAEIEANTGPEYKKVKEDIDALKIDRAVAASDKEKAEDEISDKTEEIEKIDEDLRECKANLEGCMNSISDAEFELQTKEKELAEAKAVKESIDNQMKSCGGEYKTLQDRLAQLEKSVEECGNAVQEAGKDDAKAEADRESCSGSIRSIESQIADTDFGIKDAEWNLSEVRKKAGPVADYDTLSKRILALRAEETENENRKTELETVSRRYESEYNRLTAEKRAEDRVRGNDAVSAVLAMRDKGLIKGIHGTVAELATAEEGYEMALAVAAGGKMQAIIVDNDAVAAQAIGELKSKGFGVATFLPLNKMSEGKPRAKAIMVVKDSLGYAIDLVDFKPEYRAAFWYVFGDTIVVPDMTAGRRLMGGVRIVTKDGDLFEASGAMSGGTRKKTNLKFGSASQDKIDEAGANLRAANEALDRVKSKLIELRSEIRKADEELREAGKGNVELQKDIAKYEASASQLKEKRVRLKSDLDGKKKEYETFKAAKDASSAKLKELEEKLESIKKERTDVRLRIEKMAPADLQQKLQDSYDTMVRLGEEKQALVDSLASLRAEKSDYENKRNYREAQKSKLEEEIEKNKGIVEAKSAELAEMQIRFDALKKIEKEIEDGIRDLTDKRDGLKNERYEVSGRKDKAIGAIETKNGIIMSLDAEIKELQGVVEGIRQQVAELTVEVTGNIPSEETLKRNIRAYEKEIDAIGPVNLRAIEDYDTKKKRYDGLTEKVKDLNEHVKELNKLVDTIGKKKKGLFMEVYNGVNANFKAVFKELSDGGEGFMSLDNEDDPFQGGLNINAKPRNGEVLKIDLLSGGEKSLTALAFIFAIQEYQPSPFYVLDEVDMFLDSVNSEKLAQHIKANSSMTQFIQVSLRKVTLSLADHLIGVTRPPNGVSRIIMHPNLAEVSKYEEEAQRRIEEARKAESEGGGEQ